MTAMDPIVHLPGGSIVGMEAHVVWKHPTRGNIDRGEFMDLAELIGRVSDVERAVLEFAIAETSTDHSDMRTGMNLSASTLRDPEAVGWISDRLSTAPNKMIMEVGEGAISVGGAIVVRHLRALREAGASIVLDDFGLSFASLRTLHAFPFDGVKLHNALLTEGDAVRTSAIVKAIYASAAVVGFDIVHTGIDDDLDLRRLLGLDSGISSEGFYAQGEAVRTMVEATAV
jgi:EAL domain-containing protein (putative c-di-GMP-specific phosphodiesterase class I)